MEYKTTIEIVSEAENRDEAIEIVGEYLSGNIVSGINMKCLTQPVLNYKKNIFGIALVFLLVGSTVLVAICTKSSQSIIPNISGINAIQPPLKTSRANQKNEEFKKEWKTIQARESLNYIKR